MSRANTAFAAALAALCAGCADEPANDAPRPPDDPNPSPTTCTTTLRDVPFANEEPIVIEGYDDDAMEVDISFDGEVLMWNDRVQDGPPHKNLHWARRISDTVFQYEGPVDALNTASVDGTPSFDASGNLFYTSMGAYNQNGYRSIYRTSGNGLTGAPPSLVEGVHDGVQHHISLDPDVSSDGRYLFYSWMFNPDGVQPIDEMDIRGATLDESGEVSSIDPAIFANINTEDLLEYAPTIANDGLEMYFTRADPMKGAIIGIYRATRASTDAPFVAGAMTVPAITGVVEAPAFNGDETALYYHRKESEDAGAYQIYRVTRALPPECQTP